MAVEAGLYQVKKTRLTEITHKYGLDLIVLFGSQATGRVIPGSDIDVAVRFIRRDWGNFDLELDLIAELMEAIRGDGDLDVAFLNGAAPMLLYQVAATGKLIYERNPGDFAQFRSYAARRYYDSEKFIKAQDRFLKERFAR